MNYQAYLVCVLLLSCVFGAKAQEFPVVWESKFGFEPDNQKRFNGTASLLLGSTEDEAGMIDGNGKMLWSYKFKEKLGIGSFEFQTWNEKAGVILFMESTDEKSTKVYVDEKTGTELWRTDKLNKFGDYYIDNMLRSNYIASMVAMPLFDGKHIELVNVKTGKTLWTNSDYSGFDEEGFNIQKLSDYNLIEVRNNLGVGYIDEKTGRTVDDKQVGQYRNSSVASTKIAESKEKNLRVRLDLGSRSMFSLTRMITLTASTITTNAQVWTVSFEEKVMEDLMSLGLMSEQATPNISFGIQNDKVYVIYEGISVFDISTGSKLWSAKYASSDYSGGLRVDQTLNSAARLFAGNGLFLVDRESEQIHKYDIATGKDMWAAPKISDDDVVPHMILSGNTLLAQFGGRMFVQSYLTQSQEYRYEYKFAGDSYGVRAYDATTGAVLWDTKTLKAELGDRVSNILTDGQNVYVTGEETLFALDIQTGKTKYSVNVKDFDLGEAWGLTKSEDGQRLFIDFDKGLAAVSIADGKKIYATNTKKNLGRFNQGKNCFIWVGDDNVELKSFVGTDLQTGALKGKYENEYVYNGSMPRLTDDGDYLIKFDDEKVVKYRVNK